MKLAAYEQLIPSSVPWIGSVPSHWETLPLFSVAKERTDPNEGMPEDNLLSLSFGRIVRKDMQSNDGLLPESFETYQIVRKGDIVFRLTDLQNDKRSLRTAIAEETGIITSAYVAITPTSAHPRYLHFLLRFYDQTKVFYSMGGGLRQSMKFHDLKRVPILLPSNAEQLAICEFLDRETAKIDALVGEQRRLIELLKEKRQAVISHAVTKGLDPDSAMKDSGVKLLGSVPLHWSVISVRRVIGHIEQGWSPECLSREAELTEWGVMKSGCTNGGKFCESENKALPENLEPKPQYEVKFGDVLISRASGSPNLVGSTAFVERTRPRLILSDKTFRVSTTRKIMPSYFAALFNSRLIRAQIERSISGAEGLANNLPQASLKEFRFALPPLDEQAGILTLVSKAMRSFDELVSESEKAMILLGERRAALISAAVTGKIDVRGIVAQEPAA